MLAGRGHSGRPRRFRGGSSSASLSVLVLAGCPPPAGIPRPTRRSRQRWPRVLHCPLAFEGTHLLKDRPEVAQVAYHYCKPMGDDLVAQCLLYDSTGPDARLIGVEYLVSGEVYRRMPADEQAYWHHHRYEVDAGLLKSLTQTGEEARATLAKARTLYGKIFHTWSNGKTYPQGPARLYWSVTGEEPFTLPARRKP